MIRLRGLTVEVAVAAVVVAPVAEAVAAVVVAEAEVAEAVAVKQGEVAVGAGAAPLLTTDPTTRPAAAAAATPAAAPTSRRPTTRAAGLRPALQIRTQTHRLIRAVEQMCFRGCGYRKLISISNIASFWPSHRHRGNDVMVFEHPATLLKLICCRQLHH